MINYSTIQKCMNNLPQKCYCTYSHLSRSIFFSINLPRKRLSVACQLPCTSFPVIHCLNHSVIRSQDTEIREIAEPSPFSFHSFLPSYSAAALVRDIVLTVLMVNRMWRREVFTTVSYSVHKMPYIIHVKKFHKFGNGIVYS